MHRHHELLRQRIALVAHEESRAVVTVARGGDERGHGLVGVVDLDGVRHTLVEGVARGGVPLPEELHNRTPESSVYAYTQFCKCYTGHIVSSRVLQVNGWKYGAGCSEVIARDYVPRMYAEFVSLGPARKPARESSN